ncbi:hypothetical protein K461DRAFT_272772 [Myriangium duriaei CBS 260.36]|uniref:Uncharacterized protein n=1 Tax=Myriangium duriaei CBS 260.36 TaxID=1168546 RepID=A0A9P4J7C4_9PEZI|nr:hypothetical protein K461DRAFT_272772 [Myriangium duriaei CBS 260.36]
MSTTNIKFVPEPSVGHEIGIMFGFIGAMILSMALYGVAWNIGNKRSAQKEIERIEALRASGWLKEKEERNGGNEFVEKSEPTTIG